MLQLERVPVLNIADQPADILEYGGVRAASRRTRDVGNFGFCGVHPVDHYILGSCSADKEGRLAFLEKVRQLGREG